MRRHLLLLLVLGIVSLSAYAQDDMYFTPSKQKKQSTTVVERSTVQPMPAGRDISVDEYNRRPLQSSYQKIGTDSLGNDIIEFQAGDGIYPELDDTTVVDVGKKKYNFYDDEDDYVYCRRMGMFDGFYGWYDPFFYPYHGWGPYWMSPWYGYYDWYYGYYPWYWDPWYMGWYPGYYGYYGYYGYHGWYGWGYPYYYGWYGGGYGSGYPSTTANHGLATRSTTAVSHGRGYSSVPNGRFGGTAVRRNGSSTSDVSARRSAYATSHGAIGSSSTPGFGGSRSVSSSSGSGTYSAPARSSSSGSHSGSSGSFSSGGSRSSGGSFGGGGSRSGGGSSGGSRGGGGGFGGRR